MLGTTGSCIVRAIIREGAWNLKQMGGDSVGNGSLSLHESKKRTREITAALRFRQGAS